HRGADGGGHAELHAERVYLATEPDAAMGSLPGRCHPADAFPRRLPYPLDAEWGCRRHHSSSYGTGRTDRRIRPAGLWRPAFQDADNTSTQANRTRVTLPIPL